MSNRFTTYIPWETALLIAEQKKAAKCYTEAGLVYLGIHAGLRYSDLVKVHYAEAIMGNILLKEKKTHKPRRIWLGDKQREWIKDLYELKIKDRYYDIKTPVLSNRKGEPISNTYANKLLHMIGQEYDLGVLSTHSLRKTFARRIYDKDPTDYTLVLLSEILNHANVSVTRKYLGIRQEEIKNIYEML